MQPNAPYTPGTQPTPPPQPQATEGPGYDFIMNPGKQPRRSLMPSGVSPIVRVAIALGGLLVLFIIFSIIRSTFSHSNTASLITVAEDQQEIIHLAANPDTLSQQQAVISDPTKNFALTTQLSMTSAQSDLITYMGNNGKKVNAKKLTTKVSKTLDDQLSAAASNSTYDQTFRQIMQNKLNEYEQALKIAYNQTKGPKGRKLLSNDYNGAQLLIQQLKQP